MAWSQRLRSFNWRKAAVLTAAGVGVDAAIWKAMPQWRGEAKRAEPLDAEAEVRGGPAAKAPKAGRAPRACDLPSERQRLDRFADLAPQWDGMLRQLDPGNGSTRYRAALLKRARGDVLEVCVGTGQCFQCLQPQRVKSYVGIDIVEAMLQVAQDKLPGLPFPARLQRADMHRLPFADSSFDTVFGTLCLCSSEQPERALEEMARVCRPGGRVLLLEHGLAAGLLLRWVQRFWGIHPNPKHVWEYGYYDDRDPEALVRASPLKVVNVETLGNVYVIVARREAQEEAQDEAGGDGAKTAAAPGGSAAAVA